MFNKPFNIHIIPDQEVIHVAFRVSDNYVINHVFNLTDFIKVALQYKGKRRKILWNNGEDIWELNFKKEYVKLFYKTEEADHHFRFSHEQVAELFSEFKDKLAPLREN